MTSEAKEFFAENRNTKMLRKFSSLLSPDDFTDPLAKETVQRLELAIRIIANNPAVFDKNCSINIGWIGREFFNQIERVMAEGPGEGRQSSLLTIFAYVYRFVCEFEFNLTDQDLSFELHSLKSLVQDRLNQFPENIKSQLVFAEYLMPAQVLKQRITHPHILEINEFNKTALAIDEQKKKWDSEINEKQAQVEALKKSLDEYKVGFNFVGLVRAFRDLIDKKTSEKGFAFTSLIILAICVLLPPVYEIWAFNASAISTTNVTFFYGLIPLATIEIVLVYFFRVVLLHFRSIKAQLLQLELRSALCQFIQSYAAYSSEIKQKDASALEKFESLIFSGVLTNEEQLPATFDGVEQLAKLVKSVRN